MRRLGRISFCLIGLAFVVGVFQATPALADDIGPKHHLLDRMATASSPVQATTPGNFPFHTAKSSDGLVIVHYYDQPASFATNVLDIATTVLQHPIHDTLGFSLIHPVDIFVYNSRADFLAGADVTDPAETGAYSVFVPPQVYMDTDGSMTDTLAHELTHITFHENEARTTQQNYMRFYPLWLDEGMAAYDEPADAELVSEYAVVLNQAVSTHTLVSLMDTFDMNYPSDPDRDFLGYAEARSFIGYLFTTYGAAAFHQFVNNLHDGAIWLTTSQAFHASPRELQSRWEASLGDPPANAGYLPVPIAVTPFATGSTPASASQLKPFMLPGENKIVVDFLIYAIFYSLLMGLIILNEWIWITRSARLTRERQLAAGQAHAAQMAMLGYGSLQVIPDAAPGPDAADASTATGVQVAAPPATSPERNLLHWTKFALLVAPPLVMWGVGMLWLRFSPRHEWAQSESAAVVAGFVLLILLLETTFRAPRHNHASRIVGLSIGAVVLLVMVFVSVPDLASQQAQQYADAGAFALAVQTDNDAGKTSGTDLADLQLRWAQAALNNRDFATAVRHLRAAATADPANPGRYETLLLIDVQQWGEGLLHSGQFAAAVQVFLDQDHSKLCDARCRQTMATELGTTYRTWGDSALIADQFGAAQQAYQALATNYASSPAGQGATGALQEVSAQSALTDALQAGQQGDITGMNRQLPALAGKYPQTGAASEAKETPEPVGGVIVDGSGHFPAHERLYFAAYTSHSSGASFGDDLVLMFATTIGANGTFSVRLQPGYWYVPFWEEPNIPLGQVNVSSAGDLSAFYVSPFTPANIGTIHGAF